MIIVFITCQACINQSSANSNLVFHYEKESVVGAKVSVQDQNGSEYLLLDLIRNQAKPLTVIYIFGGGAMGSKSIKRGIWCQDSYEDLHIFRSLVDNYSDRVGFIAIAEPPIFHTKQMGYKDRALLDYSSGSEEYGNAYRAFIESNKVAVKTGLIPIEPYIDIGFRLMMSEAQQEKLNDQYGEIPDWQGSFRAPDETQMYGVPAFWIVDANGKVLSEPFRGNIYHPHDGTDITLNYSLSNILAVIKNNLITSNE